MDQHASVLPDSGNATLLWNHASDFMVNSSPSTIPDVDDIDEYYLFNFSN